MLIKTLYVGFGALESIERPTSDTLGRALTCMVLKDAVQMREPEAPLRTFDRR